MKQRKKIAIIGVGLIGGSLGLALKKSSYRLRRLGVGKIMGIGRHEVKLKKAKRLGAIDEYSTDFSKGVEGADVVVIAAPVDKIIYIIKRIQGSLKDGAIITDVGSVKGEIVYEAEKLCGSRIFFVGAHPLAGSEKSGIDFASTGIFEGATVAVTPSGNMKTEGYAEAYKTVSDIWKTTGARVISMLPGQHDRLVALTSHVPHIISAAIVSMVENCNEKDKRTALLLAGSFRDLTRITDSDPELWANICRMNGREIRKHLAEFCSFIERTGRKTGSTPELLEYFSRAKAGRKKLMNNG